MALCGFSLGHWRLAIERLPKLTAVRNYLDMLLHAGSSRAFIIFTK